MRGRKARLRLLYALFLGMLGAGAALVAEFALLPGPARPVPRDIQLMGFHADAGTTLGDVPINRLGFTGDAIARARPPGTLRVLTLGGSTMFNRRMTDRLAPALKQAAGRPMEVLGAALQAHTTRASVLKYRTLRDRRFDVVLICHAINDLYANHVPTAEFRGDYSHINPWYHRGPLVDRSLLCRFLHNKVRFVDEFRLRTPPLTIQNGARFASTNTFRSNLEELVRMIRADGATPVLATMAWSIPENYTGMQFLNGVLGYNNPERYDECPVEIWGAQLYVREGLDLHNAITRDVAEKEGVLLYDSEREIGKDLKWFGDVCHLSGVGTDHFITNTVAFFRAHHLFAADAR